MTPAERLARCVIMFNKGDPWSDNDRALWQALTGSQEATTKVLCDMAREVLADERVKSGHAEARRGRR